MFIVPKALPLLDQAKTGASFILAGSTTGALDTAKFTIYSATKANVRNHARSWVLELKGQASRPLALVSQYPGRVLLHKTTCIFTVMRWHH